MHQAHCRAHPSWSCTAMIQPSRTFEVLATSLFADQQTRKHKEQGGMSFFSEVCTGMLHVKHHLHASSGFNTCMQAPPYGCQDHTAFPEDGSGVQIALVLIDEVHLLSEARGAVLEAGCISRIRIVGQLPEMIQVL